jgi:hypothetical protein
MTLNAASQMDAAVLRSNNPLIPQIDASRSLIELGLLTSVTLTIANSDPNGGGDHDGRGGNNVAYGQRSPNEVKSCVAQALSYIYSIFPNAICSIVSDGGRSDNGGDTQNFEAFITGPQDIIDTVFVNAESRNDSSTFGQNPAQARLSNGSMARPTQANVMATVAKAAGFDIEYPHIPAALKKAG